MNAYRKAITKSLIREGYTTWEAREEAGEIIKQKKQQWNI